MTDYAWAWLIVCLAAMLGAFGVWQLTRWIKMTPLRVLLVAMIATLFVVPAPIPAQLTLWAPALVVYLFEAFLQTSGSPGQSGRILLLALTTVLVIGLAGIAIQRFLRARAIAAE